MIYKISLFFILSMLFLAGCASDSAEDDGSTVHTQETVTVFAAASLMNVLQEIAEDFQRTHPNATVVFNFAGSNQLAAQILEGAPADVFASANKSQMDVAIRSGRVAPAAPVTFATNKLVVIYPRDNLANITSLQDLTKPDVLLLLAAAEVPVGQYSLDFLDKASADPAFGSSYRSRVLANVVSYEENVRSVVNKVALGEADAGIAYESDLTGVSGIGYLVIPDPLNVIAEYPIAVLSDTLNPVLASAFVDYILGEEAQNTLARYGFGPEIE